MTYTTGAGTAIVFNFNSHAHVERDFKRPNIAHTPLDFNSHAHVERDLFLCRFFLSFCHFNSHAHVERDLVKNVHSPKSIISTHTLTWSVTGIPQPYLQILTNFNSHAHVERDTFCKWFNKRAVNFNSHAHVERDKIAVLLSKNDKYFNSHAHVERDFTLMEYRCISIIFQLTRSRGA